MQRGKRRAVTDLESLSEGSSSSSVLSTVPVPTVAKKRTSKAKRAETRQCPVCSEHIPVRLLPVHSELETERVEHIIKNIGSTEVVMTDVVDGSSSSRDRRSAARARRSLSALNQRVCREDTLALSGKTIQIVRRHRKQRHTRLREATRDEEDECKGNDWTVGRGEPAVCPVCSQSVGGDEDVVEAHIDACLAHQSLRAAQEENERAGQEDAWEDIDIGEEVIGSAANLRAMGFHVRNRNEADVDEEVDVDGDDEAVFGDAQFTEGDILPLDNASRHVENGRADTGGDGNEDTQTEDESLRELVAKGRPLQATGETKEAKVKENSGGVDLTVALARKSGNPTSLIAELESKIKLLTQELACTSNPTSLLCRICIDPYTEPTVSTGCWHACCKECWLRCLGSTKLCPICKRITAATELRRIYL